MKSEPELFLLVCTLALTAVMWAPYMLARMMTRGIAATLGNPLDPTHAPDPPWAERARRAHANAVENLVVFAPLVLVLVLMNLSSTAALWACRIYLGARLVHYVVYAANISVIRTLAFVTGNVATLVIAAVLLAHL